MRGSIAGVGIRAQGTMKLVFDVVNSQRKYHARDEIEASFDSPQVREPERPNIPGYRKDGTDRGAMIAAFSRHFPGMSAKALGQLFDKYRITGRFDVQWNAETGEYDILFGSNSR
jgi:hypothetical protein